MVAREIQAPLVVYAKHNNECMVNKTINPWGIIQHQEAGRVEILFLGGFGSGAALCGFLGVDVEMMFLGR